MYNNNSKQAQQLNISKQHSSLKINRNPYNFNINDNFKIKIYSFLVLSIYFLILFRLKEYKTE